MSEVRDARHVLELAEQAAIAGDFSSAEELLREAARIQEAELGPRHPDLANTLNNLAIIAEKTGRIADAEACYRRAVEIAAACLPHDHPMVAESRQNLEDFCRERGLPIADASSAIPPAREPVPELTATPPAIASAAPPVTQPLPHAPGKHPRRFERAAIAAIVLVTIGILATRPWSSENASTPALPSPLPPSASVPAPSAGSTMPTPAPPPVLAPVEQQRSPNVNVVAPPSRSRSSGAISVTTAELCQTFSTTGGNWRCDAAGDFVAPGRLVLYTRVRSAGDSAIVHRWYRDDALQQTVRLAIRANVSEGYRTYSQHTVQNGGNWRVEARSTNGDLLYERRFTSR
jgi:hypothetical protein